MHGGDRDLFILHIGMIGRHWSLLVGNDRLV
jgi:hypothetical protein